MILRNIVEPAAGAHPAFENSLAKGRAEENGTRLTADGVFDLYVYIHEFLDSNVLKSILASSRLDLEQAGIFGIKSVNKRIHLLLREFPVEERDAEAGDPMFFHQGYENSMFVERGVCTPSDVCESSVYGLPYSVASDSRHIFCIEGRDTAVR